MNRQQRTQTASVAAAAPITTGDPVKGGPRTAKSGPASGGSGGPRGSIPLDRFFDRLILFFSSLRLTVVCLALGLVLVFWGTLAQVEVGLYKAQNEFFRSFLIYWAPKGA